MMRSAICTLAFSVSIVLTGILLTGCDDTDGTDGLTITPSSVTMTSEDTTKSFEVTGGITNMDLALPLTWTSSNDGLGSITHSDGLSAVYTRGSANGNNTITARDQYGNEGYASIKQTAATYSLTLTASPASIPDGSNTSTVSTTEPEGALAPYTWAVTSGSGSIIGGQGTTVAVFQSSGEGVSVVTCTDANGASGAVSITQEGPTPPGPGDSGGG